MGILDDPEFVRETEEAFGKHACVTAPILGGIAVGLIAAGAPGAGAIMLPAALIAGGRCLGSPYPQPIYPGWGIPQRGGRCNTTYRVVMHYEERQGGRTIDQIHDLYGPITGPYTWLQDDVWMLGIGQWGNPPTVSSQGIRGHWPDGKEAWFYKGADINRHDGLPDNCGDQPPNPWPPYHEPPYPPFPEPPTNPDGDPYIPGRDYPIPWNPGPPFFPIIIPLGIGPLILAPTISFPLTFPIDIGGIHIGTGGFNFDGTINVDVSIGNVDLDGVMRLLREIKECACEEDKQPECPKEVVYLPVYDKEEEGSCEKSQIALEVIPGSYNAEKASAIQRNAELALKGCESEKKPEQEPETLIFSGVVPPDPIEVFSPTLGPEIVSVKLVIKNFPPAAQIIAIYPSARQAKFGSIGFSLLPPGAGGKYLYVYDSETYYPLPPRAKPGVIRLLLKGGCEFELFDTGERL